MPAPDIVAKRRSELAFWKALSAELTRDCQTREQRRRALLSVAWEKTFPRYRRDLMLGETDLVGQRVLDLGCGPHGGLIGFQGCDRFGADPLIVDYLSLGYPLDEHGIAYVECRCEELPFPEAYFDTVITVNALDHVDDLAAAVREIARVLTPGGRLRGQMNFHEGGRPAEPQALSHGLLRNLLGRNGLEIELVRDQGYVREADERRFLYQGRKSVAARRQVSEAPPVGAGG